MPEMRELREHILNCRKCFDPNASAGCHHHEDLVGGCDKRKILFVGVNPQAASNNEFYERVREATNQEKMLLGDYLWRIFAGDPPPPELRHELFQEHPGKLWVKQLAACLGFASVGALACHVRDAELYKHATPGIEQLCGLGAVWTKMQDECPNWLVKQVEALEPTFVILSGALGLKYARTQLGLLGVPSKITLAHGTTCMGGIGKWHGKILFTLAVARRTNWLWNRCRQNSVEIENTVQRAMGSGGHAPEPQESPTLANEDDALFLVESRHESLNWNGVESTGTLAQGYTYERYLHVLSLTGRVVDDIANADWQGNGGRKYGPLRCEDGPLPNDANEPDAWYIPNVSNAYFPDVYPRARPQLHNGRPEPLTQEMLVELL